MLIHVKGWSDLQLHMLIKLSQTEIIALPRSNFHRFWCLCMHKPRIPHYATIVVNWVIPNPYRDIIPYKCSIIQWPEDESTHPLDLANSGYWSDGCAWNEIACKRTMMTGRHYETTKFALHILNLMKLHIWSNIVFTTTGFLLKHTS